MSMKYTVKLAIFALLLHVVWENAQAPLYAGYQSFLQHLPICSVGALGDVVITLLVFAFFWLLKKSVPSTKTDFLALAIMGFVIAVAIEQNALLLNKWSYTSAMQLVPYLRIGFAPILQMTLLLPLSFYLAGLFNRKSP